MRKVDAIIYADDDSEPTRMLFRLRAPSLFAGLIMGVVLSFVTSRFEELLTRNVQIAFFLPFIVYMAAAVGTQTEAIYSRDLKSGKARFHTYLVREAWLGVLFGAAFGIIAAVVAHVWIADVSLAAAIGLSMFAATTVAPVVALVVTEAMQLVHRDPAAGAGPIATVAQDIISVVIYGFISSWLLL